MVKEVLNRIPEAVKERLEGFKKEYSYKSYRTMERALQYRNYLKALKDAGIISDEEETALYMYVIDM